MNVTFTLTSGSSGTSAGPFNISGTTSGGALNDVSIATGVTKAQLLTGHTVNGVLDTITGGTIASTGTTCPSSTTTWTVIIVTPTPTPTVTPTPPPLYEVNILKGVPGDCGDISSACYLINHGTSSDFTIYTASGGINISEYAYTDPLGHDIFVGGPGPGYYYSDGYNYSRISSLGYITPVNNCNCFGG